MKFQKKISHAFYLLSVNPKLFWQFLQYRYKRLTHAWRKSYHGIQEILFNGIRFSINFDKLGCTHYTRSLYHQCYELHVIQLIKKYLSPGKTFIDVGANVGYISAAAAGVVGKNGLVIAFEPVPELFCMVQTLANLNPDYKILAQQYAVSENNSTLELNCLALEQCGGNSVVPEFLQLNKNNIHYKINVSSIRLDEYLLANQISNIALIKIDVEGHEFSVLKGLAQYFESTQNRPAILCEVAPAALKLLGHTIQDLFTYMEQFGYQAYDAYADYIKIDSKKMQETRDILFKVS